MDIILSIVDASVLLLLVALVVRSLPRGMSKGLGSLVLSICVAVFGIIFAVVSFTASVRFLQSVVAQIVWILVLLVMAYIVRLTWTSSSPE